MKIESLGIPESDDASRPPIHASLDVVFLQGLCDRFASEFSYPVTVMGSGGLIVASSARDRIGKVHALAARIIAGEMDEVVVSKWQAVGSQGMRPGCNTALDFRGHRVGSLGVAGHPETARKYAQIIKFCILSLMESHAAEAELQKAQAEERRKAIRDIAGRFSNTVSNIMPKVERSASEVNSTATLLLGAFSVSFNEARDITGASEKASEEALIVTENAGHLAVSINDVNSRASELTHIVMDARARVEHANLSVSGLAEAATQIGAVVQIIRKIAAQTNLLALNASIESARAGDAGKGFAVVATEVTALARRTGDATEEIAQLVQTIQKEVTVAVESIGNITQVIGHAGTISSAVTARMNEQGEATSGIARSVEQMAASNTTIETSMRRLETSNGQIEVALRGMCDLSAELDKLSEELILALNQFTEHLESHHGSD